MQAHRTLSLALILGYSALALSHAQVSPQQSVSSDDISVAEGLQLPTYGHVWALDTWKGMRELVRLRPPDTTADDSGFSLKLRHTIEFKGEAAAGPGARYGSAVLSARGLGQRQWPLRPGRGAPEHRRANGARQRKTPWRSSSSRQSMRMRSTRM